MKARLGKVEGIAAKILQLFEDLSADSPMSDSDGISLLTDQYLGSTADEPMAFVCLNSVGSLTASKPSEVKMRIKFRATKTWGESFPRNHYISPSFPIYLASRLDAPAWLPIYEGEILSSDGIKIMKKAIFERYMMMNLTGERGCECPMIMRYLDGLFSSL